MIGQQKIVGHVNITDVASGRVHTVEISTVDFPNLPGGRSLPPETCLFWNDPPRQGRRFPRQSEVVERYESWEEAIAGHLRWVNSPAEVARAMVEAGWRG